MRKNIILAAGVFMVFLCAQAVRAEMFSFSKSMGGTISDVRPNAITLTPASANQAPVNLEINDSTKLKDMQAVTELKKGDAVQVKYKEQEGKKIAVQVEKDMKAQAAESSDSNSAAGAAAGTSATTVTTTTDINGAGAMPNTEGSKNTADDQMLKTNQGTNQGAANKETPGTDQSGAESSSQFQQGSQPDSGSSYQGSSVESTQTGVKAADPTAQPVQADQNAR
jgi:hypothetical protein